MAASCPIQRTSPPTFSPSSLNCPYAPQNRGMTSSVLLMIPSVTDCDSAIGLPIASTESPTRMADESPNCAGSNSRGWSGLRRMMEMSVSGSVPTSSASISSRFHNVQNIRLACPATWWLVMM